MKKVVALSFSCFIISLLLTPAVSAKVPSGVCCRIGHSEDCPEGNYVCDAAVDPGCQAANKGECYQVGPYGPEKGKGIINPVIGIFGIQPGNITIAHLLALFLRLSLVAAGIMFILYFVWGGLQWLISGGEQAALKAARDRITNALMGIVLVALVLVVIAILNEVLHLNILNPALPTP